jgi:rare lipoprotein A
MAAQSLRKQRAVLRAQFCNVAAAGTYVSLPYLRQEARQQGVIRTVVRLHEYFYGGPQHYLCQLKEETVIKRSVINLTATSILLASFGVVATAAEFRHAQSGIASVYAGGRTANGERASPKQLTAAHRSLPFGTLVRVTSRATGRSVVVRINDRGPYVRGRVIDLTPAAASVLGFSGLEWVFLTVMGRS